MGGTGWLLPSESKLIEVNPRGATRNANKPKAILLVLNFVVAKTVIHRLLQEHRHRGSSKSLQMESQAKENLQLIATVIYWVTRAAMAQAFPGLTTLHSGD